MGSEALFLLQVARSHGRLLGHHLLVLLFRQLRRLYFISFVVKANSVDHQENQDVRVIDPAGWRHATQGSPELWEESE